MEGAGLAAQQPPAVLALDRQVVSVLPPPNPEPQRPPPPPRLRPIRPRQRRRDHSPGAGLGADPDEIRSAVFDYIPRGSAGLSFDDFEVLHRAIGDALLDGSEERADLAAEEDMREAFRVFDEDGDGLISAEELQSVLAKLDLPEGRSIDRVREMISSVDRNADGLVDFSELEKMMEGIL